MSARHEGTPVLEYLQSVKDWSQWINDSIRWSDLFFYFVAAACGYKFSFDALGEKY